MMIDTNVRFASPVAPGPAVDVARDEPSHIHIARPSRALRRDTSASDAEPTDCVRELAAAGASARAAILPARAACG
jgi:hypothetical protein